MKKPYLFLVTFLIMSIFLSACGSTGGEKTNSGSLPADVQTAADSSSATAESVQESGSMISMADSSSEKENDKNMIQIKIGDQIFDATLEDNETAKAFQNELPLTLTMNELNGNEKHGELPAAVRKDDASNPGTIQAGDLMCWQDDTLVLFYGTFKTSYDYVKIGHIDNINGLQEAVGAGDVPITISVKNKQVSSVETTYSTKEISVQNGNKNIYGEAYIPDLQGKLPTVIFSHGFGGSHDDCSTIQQILASHGVAVYAFDFCGGSGYASGQSDGSMLDMSVFTEKSDLEAVLHMIQTENFADPEQIYLLGESQGGLVSAITANDHPDEIKGLFLVYPALCIPDDARSRFRNISDIPDKIDIMGLTVGRAYYENLLDYDVYQHMAGYTGPVSIFHGTADDIVDPSYSQRAVETYTNAELTMLPGEGHGFSTAGEQKVGSAILEKIL